MSPAALTLDVYVTPMRPFAGAPGQGPGDDALAAWVRGFGKHVTGV